MKVRKALTKSLNNLDAHETGIIIEIKGGVNVANRLNSLGIVPGRKITKTSSLVSSGPVTVQVDRTLIAIGQGMAEKIIVQVDG